MARPSAEIRAEAFNSIRRALSQHAKFSNRDVRRLTNNLITALEAELNELQYEPADPMENAEVMITALLDTIDEQDDGDETEEITIREENSKRRRDDITDDDDNDESTIPVIEDTEDDEDDDNLPVETELGEE